MRGGNAQGAQHLGGRREAPVHRRITARPGPAGERTESSFIELRETRKAKRGEVYRRRRFMAVSLLVLGAVALVFAVFVQTKASDTSERAVPIDPNNAGPDPMLQNANVIEIKPDANPDVRLSVALVRSDGEAGVNDSVTAGKTELGTVADSAEVLEPQLSSYTTDAGNHVTVYVSKSG